MQRLFARIKTYRQLGLANILSVALYRLKLRLKVFKRTMPIRSLGNAQLVYFPPPSHQQRPKLHVPVLKAFGWMPLETSQPPDWLTSVINHQVVYNNQRHWSAISDFDLNIGDIKTVWEHSRFNWLFPLILDFLNNGDNTIIELLNDWLNSWLEHNPVNQGVNWKCGQEASIRVIHLVAAHQLLWNKKPLNQALAELIYHHLLRIAPTIRYAIAQDNNHGTSEACALFVGATLLSQNNFQHANQQLARWIILARETLENRCEKLIAADGCFSQNSTNYHRLMLDTLSFSEHIRQVYHAPPFQNGCYQKLQLATSWLAKTANQTHGHSAMLGLNDGAQLLPVTPCDFLDVRPSVQWASLLFLGKSAYDKNDQINQLSQLFPPLANQAVQTIHLPSTMCSDFHSIEHKRWRLFLRTPTNTFRPSQCDALHLDVWHQDYNLLLSTGSYSYNDNKWQHYFSSTKAHNTVCFDSDEQMPKLSRFLYSDWLKVNIHKHEKHRIVASYTDNKQRQHYRHIEIANNTKLVINDKLSGFKNHAVLRFHLPLRNWQLIDNQLSCDLFNIQVTSDTKIDKIALVEGWQSRYYQNKTSIWVLEVTVKQHATISTEFTVLI